MEDKSRVFGRSFVMHRSESKALAGEKRAREEVEESPDLDEKYAKMRDLESVFRSEERRNRVPSGNSRDASITIDLNTRSCDMAVNGINIGLQQVNKLSSSKRKCMEKETTSKKLKGIDFDLNAGDISSSNAEPFRVHNNHEHLKSKDESECVSSKDPMKVWKEMKQNGFLSASHGGVTVPKKRGRKSKKDGMIIKNKMELAKKEQVDRFAKIAAPSGLLSELNPGIINHVRNSKQVRSIIEALVKSEKQENQPVVTKGGDQLKSETKGFKTMSGLVQSRWNKSVSLSSEVSYGDDECSMVQMRAPGRLNCFSHMKFDKEDDLLELKLSSSTAMVSENNSSLSNEDSANLTTVTSLSVNAATVASQWLELVHQDVKGRLAALRRSKKRVRSVIQTELPFLLSKEFPQHNDDNTQSHPYSLSADAHCSRWTSLFDQMDKTLSDEEIKLENWLNQVIELRVHCDQGLLKFNDLYALQQPVPTENRFRLNKSEISEEDSAVQAAAASIYSTCNFLSSKENLPCC